VASSSLSLSRPHQRLHNPSYEWQALIVIIGTFMVILDTTVVNIALPKIITVFNASVETAQLVLTAYLIALAIIMPASGFLSNTLGTKRIYLLSLLLFTTGSLMTTAMNTLPGPLIAGGSSLTNVLRQLFGAFGTAIFVTMLQTRQTYHQAVLSQTVTPSLPAVHLELAQASHYLLQHGMTLAQAKVAAVLALYQGVALSAAVLSFEDCFLIAAAICLLGVVPALFLSSSGVARRPGGPAALE
jgi:MFS family permease